MKTREGQSRQSTRATITRLADALPLGDEAKVGARVLLYVCLVEPINSIWASPYGLRVLTSLLTLCMTLWLALRTGLPSGPKAQRPANPTAAHECK